MKLDRWIQKLLPRSEKFLELFVKDVENLSEATQLLRELMSATTEQDRVRIVRSIEDLEHRGDEITHTIFHELSLTFITTLDREDIGDMASALDNVLDGRQA